MPLARNGEVGLHWEAQGTGDPVLLIMGLGGSSRAWYRLLPHLHDTGRRVILFDNRGTGRSDRIDGRIRMRDMVRDALVVLDAAGEDSADVLGVSMGGMIAQHLALEHRARVRSLILGCTTANARAGAPSWRLLTASAMRQVAPARALDVIAPALYAEHTRREHPERIAEDFAVRREEATPGATFLAQMRAIAGHDVRGRLHELDGLQVTVVHGDEDALVPPARGRELVDLIPGAVAAPIAGAGHLLLTDAEEATVAALLGHLAAAARRTRAVS